MLAASPVYTHITRWENFHLLLDYALISRRRWAFYYLVGLPRSWNPFNRWPSLDFVFWWPFWNNPGVGERVDGARQRKCVFFFFHSNGPAADHTVSCSERSFIVASCNTFAYVTQVSRSFSCLIGRSWCFVSRLGCRCWFPFTCEM